MIGKDGYFAIDFLKLQYFVDFGLTIAYNQAQRRPLTKKYAQVPHRKGIADTILLFGGEVVVLWDMREGYW